MVLDFTFICYHIYVPIGSLIHKAVPPPYGGGTFLFLYTEFISVPTHFFYWRRIMENTILLTAAATAFLVFCFTIEYRPSYSFILRLFRVLSAVLIIIMGTSFFSECFSAFSISLSILILIFASFFFSNKWSCPYCGKHFGIKIWFHNRCPHCGCDISTAHPE